MNRIQYSVYSYRKIVFVAGLLLAYALTIHAQEIDNDLSKDVIKGRLRIKVKENSLPSTQEIGVSVKEKKIARLGVQSIDNVNSDIGITNMRRVFPFSAKNELKHRKYGLHLWYEIEYDSAADAKNILKKYQQISDIEIVKPVYKVKRLDENSEPVYFKNNSVATPGIQTFTDPLLVDQWHYNNDGNVGSQGVDIDLFEAWETSTGSSDIVVSVVDQGVDVFHEDLKNNIWRNEAEINGIQGVDDDNNGYIDDYNGWNFRMRGAITPGSHGTHVAGTVAAVSNNGIGVAGVAGGNGNGNGVKLMSCQVFDNLANGGANFAEAIVYGADNGAVISQNSWGYNQSNFYDPEILDAIRYFIAEAGQYEGSKMKGGIVIFAAGNTGDERVAYPGAFDEVLAVSSTGPTGYPSSFATFGEWVDLSAPGGDQENFGEKGGILSTLPGDKYGYIEGTSMSCPHVSGVAALIISKFGGPDFTPGDLRRMILNSTDRYSFEHNNKYGKGGLNAAKALINDNRIPPNPITDLGTKAIFHDEIRLTWTVPADPDGKEPAYYILAGSGKEITNNNFDNNALFIIENNRLVNASFEAQIVGLIKKTSYWFAIKSADQFDNISSISNILHVVTSDDPQFMESTRKIELTVDVTSAPIQKSLLNFSNTGEGVVYWDTKIHNEEIYTQSFSISEANAEVSMASVFSAGTMADTATSKLPVYKMLQNPEEAVASIMSYDHWQNDDTEFVAGLTYENETYPSTLMGSGNANIGLIAGTRFDIPYDNTFNLTHLEVVLLPETKASPIIVEIKSGGRNHISEAKTIYTTTYYPDTTNVLKYYRIPIYRPQQINENESFWVVLHFPKEMKFPLPVQYGEERLDGIFVISRDNGRNYQNASDIMLRNVNPMLRVLSTGTDGSYVFLNPNSGEIVAGASQQVETIIDATYLKNGAHLASLGIVTNDIDKPVVNIEVKVNVVGQKPKVNLKTYKFDAYVNANNKFNLDIENIGLGQLDISGLSSIESSISPNFSGAISIEPGGKGYIPFLYNPGSLGLTNTKINLTTNIGVLSVSVQLANLEAPLIELQLEDSVVNVTYGSTSNITLKIKNKAISSDLMYDLQAYSLLNSQAGILAEKLTYSILASDEAGGPTPNQWDDISVYGTSVDLNNRLGDLDIGMKFPFFDKFFQQALPNLRSELSFGNFDAATFYPIGLWGKYLKPATIVVHDFGDKYIFSVKGNVISQREVLAKDIEYQIVLFRNGAFEYRYKNVTGLTPDFNYYVFATGLTATDSVIYRKPSDASKELTNGMVIRFSPKQDVTMIGDAFPNNGVVTSGDSVSVQLVVSPKSYNVFSGSYKNLIIVRDNTAEGQHAIPVRINIVGTPALTIQQDSIVFGRHNIGKEFIQYVEIKNTGSASLTLTNATLSLPDFEIKSVLPITIEASSRYYLPVGFSPSSLNEIVGNLILTSSNGQSASIVVTGEGRPDPTFTHTVPTPIIVNLIAGNTTGIPFTISNTSTIPLEYGFTTSLFTSVEQTSPTSSPTTINELGDCCGYSWRVSDTQKVFHKWFDITDQSSTLIIKQDEQLPLVLPFKFPFFGEEYDTIWISKNGYVTVIKPEKDPSTYTFSPNDGVKGMISPFWSALKPSVVGDGVKIKIESQAVYLQWNNFSPDDVNQGLTTFQLELRADGNILFHYKDVEQWPAIVKFGIESPDELVVLEEAGAIIVPWASFRDNSTLVITPPSKGVVSANTSSSYLLKLSAKDFYYPGIYKDSIVMQTNSYQQSVVKIPVEFHVTGSPLLQASDSLVWKEIVYQSGIELRKNVKLTNMGHDVMHVMQISHVGLSGLTLYAYGNKIIKNSAGVLINPLVINPWESIIMEAVIPVLSNQNITGKIFYDGNFSRGQTVVSGEIVESPVMTWNATDQSFNVINTKREQYTFNIKNDGSTRLIYTLTPSVIPNDDPNPGPVVIDKIGHYQKEKPLTIDSLSIDKKQISDGVFTPWVGGIDLGFSNRFVAPAEGFYLTHIKIFNYLDAINEYVRIMVYYDGDLPQSGEKVYEQKFLIDKPVNKEWIYFPLEKPISIPGGKTFYVITGQPQSVSYVGLELTNDPKRLNESFSGVYKENGNFYWWPNVQDQKYIWKIRPLTAAGEGQWLALDQEQGQLLQGGNQQITATIDPSKIGSGVHRAKILLKSNDINHSIDDVDVTINVNAAPDLIYRPNIYEETLTITETESRTLNYLFSDPEKDEITVRLESQNEGPKVNLVQTGSTTAQIIVKTDYEDAGFYVYAVVVSDAAGNEVVDSVRIEVLNRNRPPVFNSKYELIYLNLAGSSKSLVIHPDSLFTDPDGDALQILAGNYSPELVDMALGNAYINFVPLAEGTANILFGADDGGTNGFVIASVNIIILNDPNAPQSGTSGNQNNANPIVNDELPAIFEAYPNPTNGQDINLHYTLDQDAKQIEVLLRDSQGKQVYSNIQSNIVKGDYRHIISLKTKPGLYLCTMRVDNRVPRKIKIIIN